VAADADNLILTSFTDNSVRLWDPRAGRVLARHDDLALPVSAIRYSGEIVIAEHGAGRVISMAAGGARVLAEGLPAPTGLATDGQRLYVSDRVRGEILEIARDGQPVVPRVVATGLDAPEGLALLGDDLIVVEGESGRVLRIKRDGIITDDQVSLVALVAPGTPPVSAAQPPSMVFNGVAVLGDVLYVTGEINRVLYRIDLGAEPDQSK
jgi:glucose/arabinose dehydrogenase